MPRLSPLLIILLLPCCCALAVAADNKKSSGHYALPAKLLGKPMLIDASEADVRFVTAAGVLLCKKGAVAMVVDRGRDIGVYVFDSHAAKDVRFVLYDKREITIGLGQELVLTDSTKETFDHVNPMPIAYRKLMETDLGDGIRAFNVEFSIPSAFMQAAPLKAMRNSEKPADKKLVAAIMKNATIMATLTASHGQFKVGGQ